MADHLLQENAGKIVLEDGSGTILLESSQPSPPALGNGGTIQLNFARTPRVQIQ